MKSKQIYIIKTDLYSRYTIYLISFRIVKNPSQNETSSPQMITNGMPSKKESLTDLLGLRGRILEKSKCQ